MCAAAPLASARQRLPCSFGGTRSCSRLLLVADPHEAETLLPPLMGLQVHGTRVEGGTLVVSARLSLNMASLTLEQVAGARTYARRLSSIVALAAWLMK